MIYKCVDSACPLFLVSRYLSVRKMFVCYIKITTCTFQTKPCEIYHVLFMIYSPLYDKYSPLLKNVSHNNKNNKSLIILYKSNTKVSKYKYVA